MMLADKIRWISQESDWPLSAIARRSGLKVGTQTIEQTAKRWKGARVIGSVCAIAGLTSILANAIGKLHTPSMLYFGLVALVLGVAVNFAGRLGAWWFHG